MARSRKHRNNTHKPIPAVGSQDLRDSYIKFQGEDPEYQAWYAPFERFQAKAVENQWPHSDIYTSLENPGDEMYRDYWLEYQYKNSLIDFLHQDHPHLSEIKGNQGHDNGYSLEDKIVSHVRLIQKGILDQQALFSVLANFVGDGQDMDIVFSVSTQYGHPDMALLVALFSPFWVRRPQTAETQNIQTFIKHIFGQFDVPEFLYSPWTAGINSDSVFEWIACYLTFAQGGCIHHVATALWGWQMPASFPQYLFCVPAGLGCRDACCFAEVLRLGGKARDYHRLANNSNNFFDMTGAYGSDDYDQFCLETITWLIANGDQITDESSNLILDYAYNHYLAHNISPFHLFGKQL